MNSQITAAFSATGPLAKAHANYKPRAAQTEMAQAIADAMSANTTLVAEAGTGTGKTYAYLVPALLNGGRVLISTGTKTLQDQLFERDIPAVRAAFPVPVAVALLKGRANYVCHHHLERAIVEGRLASRDDVARLHKIASFAKSSVSGDKAECADISDDSPVWQQVTSTRENCLGTECAHHDKCFVVNARKAAMESEIVVVNHHLFFADLALKDEGVAELLPAANAVIFDEAHKLPDAASMFFGEQLTSGQFLELARDVEFTVRAQAKDAVDVIDHANGVGLATRKLRLALGTLPIKKPHPEVLEMEGVRDAMSELINALAQCEGALEVQAARTEDLSLLFARATGLRKAVLAWLNNDDASVIRWAEVIGGSFFFHGTPFSVAEIFAKQREGNARAWIFTSATLSAAGSFNHFTNQLGLTEAECKSWESPFDYPAQAALFVPAAHFPLPSAPEHTEAVLEAALTLLAGCKGGAFLLFTSHRALKQAAAKLPELLEAKGMTRKMFVQGEAPKHDLLERFREASDGILLGSQSFWEGVDVQGEALSLVVIDKLPFAPPDDPVLSARLKHLEENGGNAFMQWQLPQAAITLKQGAGRLIRSETDRGVLAVMDTRLADKPYGKALLKSLPAMTRTRSVDRARMFLVAPVDQAEAPNEGTIMVS
jgi:ATP-dependent DNA helicase DinG